MGSAFVWVELQQRRYRDAENCVVARCAPGAASGSAIIDLEGSPCAPVAIVIVR